HGLRSENDERFAPSPQRLSTQQVEILSGVGRLADLEIITGGELQESLNASARMLGPLAFISMRQKQHKAGKQSPLVFTRADELVDNCLADVGEVAELRFPQHQRLGIVAAVPVFESQHAGFRERRVIDFAARLFRTDLL